jgi:hypothetical protein
MLFNDGFWEVEIFLSESGCPGLKDFQDAIAILQNLQKNSLKLSYLRVLCVLRGSFPEKIKLEFFKTCYIWAQYFPHIT